ncbi:uncharacterized, partial [Tachysurus ichikawai]
MELVFNSRKRSR